VISGPGSGEGELAQANSFLAGKSQSYAGMDAQMPYFGDLAQRASGQFLCSVPVTKTWQNPTVTVSGIRPGELGPTVEAFLFAPRGQPELQLRQSTHDIRNGVATLKFDGTLPALGVVFVAYWVNGVNTDPEWSDLSVTLQ
jgi:hypothetical protein